MQVSDGASVLLMFHVMFMKILVNAFLVKLLVAVILYISCTGIRWLMPQFLGR